MRKLRWKWSSLWMAGLLLAACSLFEPEKKTRFDYGGDPLPGTENLYNLRLSPDGEWVALIRAYTPERLDPPNQLWLVRRDGRQMRFLGASIGSVDWSPDGKRLALNYEPGLCCDTYVVTLDLESGQVAVWTGADTLLLSHPTASFPHWFQDGRRLLVSVIGKAYGQLYETGIYVLNLEHRQVEGPLVKSMVGAQLGGRDRFAVGIMPQPQGRVYRENAVRYEFATGALTVLTDFGPEEAFRFAVTPSPVEDLIVLERRVEGVPQLFLMDGKGRILRQLTERGGHNPRWSYDGRAVLFLRDVEAGPGARNVPFVYWLDEDREEPLWPMLPDSVPAFPALDTLLAGCMLCGKLP
ncbi:WD40-like beta Propeller containing protein [Rhodothermus marinus SG0.5JP17-172]|uniref:TolB family protein n=1 Tax=Rhodothermus marinus TaxID=29549 RepID=UPI000223DCE7|nr:hypothetical protein [Rhodothermus marinus]AEN73713.1 WD40-like beta Propeller containing protein [Rhodothermus marinus SG0.5JP17-172]